MGARSGTDDGLLGESLDDAAAAAADAGDVTAVGARSRLETIAGDGTLTRDALDRALGETAQYVSTPETRLEFAEQSLDGARETAADHEDVPFVRHRLTSLEARADAFADDVVRLADDLQVMLAAADDPDDLLALAGRVGDVRERADRLAGRIDQFAETAEEFRRWLTAPRVRYDELQADVDGLERSIDELGNRVDAAETSDAQFGVAVETRVLDLVRRDAEHELAAAETLDSRAGVDDVRERRARLADRLDALAERQGGLEADAATLEADLPADRAADLAALDDALADVEPPVDWNAVRDALPR